MPLSMSLEEAEALPPNQPEDEFPDCCERCGNPKALFLALRDDHGWVMLNLGSEPRVWCLWLCENCRSWKAVIFLADLYRLEAT